MNLGVGRQSPRIDVALSNIFKYITWVSCLDWYAMKICDKVNLVMKFAVQVSPYISNK